MDRLTTTRIFNTKSSPKIATNGRKMRFAGLEKTPPVSSSSFAVFLILDATLEPLLSFVLEIVLDFLYAARTVGACQCIRGGLGVLLVPLDCAKKPSVQWNRAKNKIRDPISFMITSLFVVSR